MKAFVFILLFVAAGCIARAQVVQFNTSRLDIEYHQMHGKFNGEYVSRYKNGVVRAKGNFANNVRSGIWTVYDSTGRKIQERNYSKDHLSFEKTEPVKPKNGAASLFDSSFYHAKKNISGVVEYYPITERSVICSTRIWRSLTASQNDHLFKKDFLYKVLFGYITDGISKSYCSSDEGFKKQLPAEELKKYTLSNYKIISWKIKEDWIYDIDRNVSETRIIGICPVGINKSSKDTTDLYWIYYPYAREALAKECSPYKNQNGEVETLEDIFFFRNFTSQIIKVSNMEEKSLEDICKTKEELQKRQTSEEIQLIEREHDIWMGIFPD